MPALRRLAATSLVAILALAGCSSAADETEDAATITVTTDYGEVEIPEHAERVVVLNYALAGFLYDLDVPVVGMIPEDADGEGAPSDFWADDFEAAGTEFLPWSVDGFDLEAILAADPDLIVGGGIGFPLFHAVEAYDDLTAIAPTVLVSGDLSEWQDQFAFLADDVFGQPEVYDEALATYEARVEEVRAAITLPEAPAAFLTLTADGTAFALVESVGLPVMLAELGIEPAPLFASGDFEVYGGGGDMFELSTEQVGQVITQPTVFVMGFNGDFADVASLSENPVYAALPSFESGSAYDLPYWALRGDFDEAMATLDLLEEQFAR